MKILNQKIHTVKSGEFVILMGVDREVYVFDGTELQKLTDPTPPQESTAAELKELVEKKMSGMTIKDVARHKDVRRLQEQVEDLARLMGYNLQVDPSGIGCVVKRKESE